MTDQARTEPRQDNTDGRSLMDTAKSHMYGFEKFSEVDLTTLRCDLLQPGLDSFQAAEVVANFLSGRGYGISRDEARGVATRIEAFGCTVETVQQELERVARFA